MASQAARHEKAKSIIEALVGEKIGSDLFETMKDGNLLSRLTEALQPNRGPARAGMKSVAPSAAKAKGARSFFYVGEIVTKFNQACKQLGVEESILFQPTALEDRRSFEKVVDCIIYVAVKKQASESVSSPSSFSTIVPSQPVTPRSALVGSGLKPRPPGEDAETPAPAPVPIHIPAPAATLRDSSSAVANSSSSPSPTSSSAAASSSSSNDNSDKVKELEEKLREETTQRQATEKKLGERDEKLSQLERQLQEETRKRQDLEGQLQSLVSLRKEKEVLEKTLGETQQKLEELQRSTSTSSSSSSSSSLPSASSPVHVNSTPSSSSPASFIDEATLKAEASKYVKTIEEEVQKILSKKEEKAKKRKELEQRLEELRQSKRQVETKASSSTGSKDPIVSELEEISRLRQEKTRIIEAEEKEKSNLEAEIRTLRRSLAPPTPSSSSSKIELRPGFSFEVIRWDELDVGKQIGTGAFAEVFEAYRAGERVAVKRFLNQGNNEDSKKELETEVGTMSQLHSNYVVSMYGACFDPPNMCIVMEFLARGSLFYILSDPNVELPWNRRWNMARDAAVGMAYLHSKRPPLLHKDFKSGNLLVTTNWRVKICDFGSSNPNEAGVDAGGLGTVRWTAPEVINGDPYTTAGDVYSYGIVLWELATRKIPFEVETNYELPKMVAGGKRPPIPDDCPRDYRKLMEWCWHQQASQRPSFADVVQFFEKKGLLDDVLAGETDDTIAKLEAVEKKTDELKMLKERLERQWETSERRADREKDARAENERATEELEKQLIKEREKVGAAERQLQSLERKLTMEKEQQTESEKKKKKNEKKNEQKKKAVKEELILEKESIERKMEQEVRKQGMLRRQVDDAESLLEQERARRIEVERQRDDAQSKASSSSSSTGGSSLSVPDSGSSVRSRSPRRS